MRKWLRMARTMRYTVALVLTLALCAGAVAALAEASTATAGPSIDWSTLLTQVVVWAIGALAGVAAWALKKYVYPWFLTAAVPWMETHNLVTMADVAVKYAEAELGRYTGAEKWKMAIDLMRAKGFDVNSDEVIAALKAAWETLDLEQITAGIKDAKPPDAAAQTEA